MTFININSRCYKSGISHQFLKCMITYAHYEVISYTADII